MCDNDYFFSESVDSKPADIELCQLKADKSKEFI